MADEHAKLLAFVSEVAAHLGSADPYEDCGHGDTARDLIAEIDGKPYTWRHAAGFDERP